MKGGGKMKKKGFTLIELLVVIAIIGLLSTLAVVALNSAREKARDAKRIADVKQVQTALELYFNDADGYPAQDNIVLGDQTTPYLVLCYGETAPGANGFVAAASGCMTDKTVYMGLVPTAPQPEDGDCTDAQNEYTYDFDATTDEYAISFCLGGTTGGLDGGAHTASPSGIE